MIVSNKWLGIRKKNKAGTKKIPFTVLSKNLINSLKIHKDQIGRIVLLPNSYTIYFSSDDRNSRKKIEEVMIAELREDLYRYAKGLCPGVVKSDFRINFYTDDSMPAGKFKIDCNFSTTYGNQKFTEQVNRTYMDNGYSENEIKALPLPVNTVNSENSFYEGILTVIEKRFVLFIERDNILKKQELGSGVYDIGRGKNSDIQLKGAGLLVSRRHIELEISDDGIFVTSFGKNGTKVNGKFLPVGKKAKIFLGSIIRIGSFRLKLIDKLIT